MDEFLAVDRQRKKPKLKKNQKVRFSPDFLMYNRDTRKEVKCYLGCRLEDYGIFYG